jgi:hypothetical protein
VLSLPPLHAANESEAQLAKQTHRRCMLSTLRSFLSRLWSARGPSGRASNEKKYPAQPL